jgi:hypothetical protein
MMPAMAAPAIFEYLLMMILVYFVNEWRPGKPGTTCCNWCCLLTSFRLGRSQVDLSPGTLRRRPTAGWAISAGDTRRSKFDNLSSDGS